MDNVNHRYAKGANRAAMKSIKNNRKGVVDVQFNWIFVLVAGFVIFLFIISIIYSQKGNADKQAGISTANQINTVLKSRQQSGDVYSQNTIPQSDITFTCDEDTQIFNFKTQNSERIELSNAIIFAPSQFSTSKLLIWSQPFEMGFPVSGFEYITTSDSIIIIYTDSDNKDMNDAGAASGSGGSGDSTDADASGKGSSDNAAYISRLFEDLPGNITKIVSKDISRFDDYKRKRIICLKGDCPEDTAYDIDYLMITPGKDGLYEYGNVTFHQSARGIMGAAGMGGEVTLPYITKAGLYGAIFSYSPSYYNCQMKRALSQFEVKRTLVEKRLQILQAEIENNDCETTMAVISNEAIKPMKDLELNWENVTSAYERTGKLDTWNTDLMLSSCPRIY